MLERDQSASAILSVSNLTKRFRVATLPRRKFFTAIQALSFDLAQGDSLALVGESGSGKTTAARCILRLEEPTAGQVVFRNQDVTNAAPRTLRSLYRDMQLVFQDPNSSLNPRMTIAQNLAEPLRLHLHMHGKALNDRLDELVDLVGLGSYHLSRYPHQLSGGQRQRIGIGRAIATDPSLLFLDEPTSSLDVSVRGQILQLLLDLQRRLGLSYVFISHDLRVVRRMCSRAIVLKQGKVIETGTIDDIFNRPRMEYTQRLIESVPTVPGNWSETWKVV